MLLAAGGLEAYASADYGGNEKSLHNEVRAHDLIRFDDPIRPCWHQLSHRQTVQIRKQFLVRQLLTHLFLITETRCRAHQSRARTLKTTSGETMVNTKPSRCVLPLLI